MKNNQFSHLTRSLSSQTKTLLSQAALLKKIRNFILSRFKHQPIRFDLGLKNKTLFIKTSNRHLISELRFLEPELKSLDSRLIKVRVLSA